jgi:hypothetical protein
LFQSIVVFSLSLVCVPPILPNLKINRCCEGVSRALRPAYLVSHNRRTLIGGPPGTSLGSIFVRDPNGFLVELIRRP